MMTLPEFVEKYKVTLTSTPIARRTDGFGGWGENHWKFTLSYKGREFNGEFSGGSAVHECDVCSVLDCLVTDATFYDSEPEDDEDLVKVGKRTKRELRKLFGYYMYNKLVNEVEPY